MVVVTVDVNIIFFNFEINDIVILIFKLDYLNIIKYYMSMQFILNVLFKI